MKTAVFLVAVPCSAVQDYQSFRGACCLHNEDITQMSVTFHQTTQCNNPEGSHFHTHNHENLKSHTVQKMAVQKFVPSKIKMQFRTSINLLNTSTSVNMGNHIGLYNLAYTLHTVAQVRNTLQANPCLSATSFLRIRQPI
jgi:hypothetical protein